MGQDDIAEAFNILNNQLHALHREYRELTELYCNVKLQRDQALSELETKYRELEQLKEDMAK